MRQVHSDTKIHRSSVALFLSLVILDAPEKMDPGIEDSVDSRKEPQCGSL